MASIQEAVPIMAKSEIVSIVRSDSVNTNQEIPLSLEVPRRRNLIHSAVEAKDLCAGNVEGLVGLQDQKSGPVQRV